MTIGLGHYLTVAACLFTLGIFGIFINRKNVIVILMSIELMLAGRQHQPRRVFAFQRRPRRAGIRALRSDGCGSRGGNRACDHRRLLRNRGSIAVEDINMMKG